MSFEDFIDEEDVEFVDELEHPKKYHYEEHSDDTIHFYKDGEEIICDEIVDLLNKQSEQIKELEKENKFLRCTIESNSQDDYIGYLEKQNERLKERITELASKDKIVFINGQ